MDHFCLLLTISESFFLFSSLLRPFFSYSQRSTLMVTQKLDIKMKTSFFSPIHNFCKHFFFLFSALLSSWNMFMCPQTHKLAVTMPCDHHFVPLSSSLCTISMKCWCVLIINDDKCFIFTYFTPTLNSMIHSIWTGWNCKNVK